MNLRTLALIVAATALSTPVLADINDEDSVFDNRWRMHE